MLHNGILFKHFGLKLFISSCFWHLRDHREILIMLFNLLDGKNAWFVRVIFIAELVLGGRLEGIPVRTLELRLPEDCGEVASADWISRRHTVWLVLRHLAWMVLKCPAISQLGGGYQ